MRHATRVKEQKPPGNSDYGWNLIRLGSIALVYMIGLASVSYAADTSNDAAKKPILPPVELNGALQGYSVELDTDRPSQFDTRTPNGLAPLRGEDKVSPFFGLKLTKPLETK